MLPTSYSPRVIEGARWDTRLSVMCDLRPIRANIAKRQAPGRSSGPTAEVRRNAMNSVK